MGEPVAARSWAENKGSLSVNYGPLSFALKIGEIWQKYGNDEKWPQWEVLPTTAWNYGLVPNWAAFATSTPDEDLSVPRGFSGDPACKVGMQATTRVPSPGLLVM